MPIFESTTQVLIFWGVIGYLFGSIPTGVILARVMGLGNLRDIGSGNIGATNVLRTGNKTAAGLTLLFDALKAIVPILLARAFAAEDAAQLAAIAAFFGHCCPIWLRFQGGKGVATYFGILFVMAWPAVVASCLIWLAVAAIWRYSSLAALITAGWTPVIMVFTGNGFTFFLGVVLGLGIYLRHLKNIGRLKRGEETKFGAKG